MKKEESKKAGFGTRTIHAGQEPDPTTGAVMTPIYQTSTYAQESPGKFKGYDYTRSDNPTRTAYQNCVAALENGNHGLAFSSGVAAISALAATLKQGDHIVSCDDVYGGTYRLFTSIFSCWGIETSFVDLTDHEAAKKAFRPSTKLLWIESPTNPLLKVQNIPELCKIARAHNAISAVDNTFMSPYFQKPLDLGADVVMHSVTKYMNGHSDVIGGILVTNSNELHDSLKHVQNSMGSVPGPMDTFLVLRGLKTLHVRMDRHAENAIELAKFLESHSKIEKVIYPGLESHPQHLLAKSQMTGFGGMISFFLRGDLSDAKKFLERVKIFTLAESLGGVESLIEHPAIMTHSSIPKETRESIGILDNLIRISVGIEDLSDLKADLANALS